MGKDDINSTFDFDSDPEFNENFYKNIEMAFNESEVDTPKAEKNYRINSEKNSKDTAKNITVEADKSLENNNTDEAAITAEAVEPYTEEEISEEEIDDQLSYINASLAKKICEEMDSIGAETNQQEQKKSRFFKIQNGILLTLLCLVGFGFFFGFTKPGNQLLMNMGIGLTGQIWTAWTDNFHNNDDLPEDTDHLDDDDLSSDAMEVDPSEIVWDQLPGDGRHEEGVYNILMLGEEAIGSGTSRGRTDVIVIATLNTNTKKILLTSLLRDTLVQIPGYQDNKLNSAYEKGGLDLLYETIALNFDIQLDGCVMVNFENFEKIIDRLGGLEIKLTSGEAKYLNSTNYISKPQYRNVVAGSQLLNGNQVLGYSRVRKRATITGNNNDYGRTDRHRIVLNAIFDKYKTKSKVELASMMINILPMITTDIDSDCFELLLNSFIEMHTMEMTQLRIPADGTFTDNVKVRGMDILIPDLQENVEILHNFIFGEDSTEATLDNTDTNAATTDTSAQ